MACWCKITRRRPLPPPKPEGRNYRPYNPKYLRAVQYTGSLQFTGDSVCTIDLLWFRQGDMTIVIPVCKHLFHPTCIREWLKSQTASKRCPNCNSDIFEYEVVVEEDNILLYGSE